MRSPTDPSPIPKSVYVPNWDASCHPARLGDTLADGTVQCRLSPRNCKIAPGKAGFCGVRLNQDGQLITLNYGRATHVTQESIETEAVFHYGPGAPILSLGNIGCMMSCDYCHNWKTSQARQVSRADIHHYTPEDIVEIALARNIPVISWTYNDPVVWHEFVLDTSRLAKKHGLHTLFKSAFFISMEGAAELCEVIDIFSVSLKSMDPEFYRRLTKGQLEPVLEATKYVYDQGKHVEISNLLVTDANDTVEQAVEIADWVLETLSDTVPLHYVRFHPDYKYTHVGRTPVHRLEAARQAALERGIKYCYLGNVQDSDAVHTYCTQCGSRLIERFGLNAQVVGLDADGRCRTCATPLAFRPIEFVRFSAEADLAAFAASANGGLSRREFLWHGDINALHVEVRNQRSEPNRLMCRRLGPDGVMNGTQQVSLQGDESFRFILSKHHPTERGVELYVPSNLEIHLFEVYDRAHYPTMDLDSAQRLDVSLTDAVPLPFFVRGRRGRQAVAE